MTCRSRLRCLVVGLAGLVLAPVLSGAAYAQTQPTATGVQSSGPAPQAITFYRDIEPILQEKCISCHQPDGGAPFSLLAFPDVRSRASLIARVTQTRYMPPWKPQPGHGDFADVRRLSDEQVALIQQWVQNGALEGDPSAGSGVQATVKEWELGTPDVVITMPEPYLLSGEGSDTIRSFVIPVPGGRRRFVKAAEFHPGNPRVVHHANIKIDSTGSSRRLDAGDAPPGFDGSSRDARFPDGYFLGWTPGQRPYATPRDAWQLPAGADVIVELHLTPSGKSERVQSSVGLYLTDVAPSRTPYMIRLGSQRIDIPAGAEAYVSTDTYALPVDVDVLAVQPHAHNLARSMKGYARLPDGRREWLIDIPDWDFRWQDVYRYASPMRLPRGTVLEMEYTYDNSAGNPKNPNQPPRRVTFGQTTSSEMGDLWLQVATGSDRDRAALDADYAPKMLREDIAGDETILLTNPGDARLRMDLAFCYIEAGRAEDAVAQFERALEIDPDSAAAHHDLGTILLRMKRLDDAATHFRRAVALNADSAESFNGLGAAAYLQGATADAIGFFERSLRLRDNAEARFNLGRAFAREHRPDEAIAQYNASLAIKPADPETHAGLAAVLSEVGQTQAAVTHYREALGLEPNLIGAIADLAWILATAEEPEIRRPTEAVRLAEQAMRLTGSRNAIVLDTLAISYFSAGRVDDAIRTGRAAVDLAVASNDATMADRLRLRLRLYEDAVQR